jgi:hypothetical protein
MLAGLKARNAVVQGRMKKLEEKQEASKSKNSEGVAELAASHLSLRCKKACAKNKDQSACILLFSCISTSWGSILRR